MLMGMSENIAQPWDREAYLKTVDEKHLEIATRLCDLLESVYDSSDIGYAGAW